MRFDREALLPAALVAMMIVVVPVHAAQPAATLITHATIIDGTGAPAMTGSLRIAGDLIVAIGSLSVQPGDIVIDANGKVLAPGFIDSHSHHDDGIFERRTVPEALSQGITTIVAGQDGASNYPLSKFFHRLDRTPASINVASYVGHSPLREDVMGDDYKRVATNKEVSRMQKLLARELRAGALGLATGLEYEPGSYSAPAEVLELARESARHGGRYISHIRSEDVYLDKAIEEVITIGREVCLPVQISHIKLGQRTRWGDAPALLQRLDAARADGIEVSADIYPYDFWQSTLTVLFPES
jgi:N-acyl-D-amino-acid deacylase